MPSNQNPYEKCAYNIQVLLASLRDDCRNINDIVRYVKQHLPEVVSEDEARECAEDDPLKLYQALEDLIVSVLELKSSVSDDVRRRIEQSGILKTMMKLMAKCILSAMEKHRISNPVEAAAHCPIVYASIRCAAAVAARTCMSSLAYSDKRMYDSMFSYLVNYAIKKLPEIASGSIILASMLGYQLTQEEITRDYPKAAIVMTLLIPYILSSEGLVKELTSVCERVRDEVLAKLPSEARELLEQPPDVVTREIEELRKLIALIYAQMINMMNVVDRLQKTVDALVKVMLNPEAVANLLSVLESIAAVEEPESVLRMSLARRRRKTRIGESGGRKRWWWATNYRRFIPKWWGRRRRR